MPTDEQRALWAAIRANPGDDTERLAYADWLQEHGDEARAEFIRVQCRIVQLQTDSRARRKVVPGLRHREQVLLTANRERWVEPVFRALHGRGAGSLKTVARSVTFQRGFIWGEQFDIDFAHRLATTPHLEPLDHVRVFQGWGQYSTKKLSQLFAWDGIGCVREFVLLSATDDSIRAVLDGPTQLASLTFRLGQVTDTGAGLLAGWARATTIAALDLSAHRIGDKGADALAGSPYFDKLTSLVLEHNPIGRTGRQRLVARFGGNVQLPPEPE